ncbi:MAG: SipW-dependent-type signal peptide-containing protein, partial [Oscillospiraceae bacterium]|nr:SipW-dependent-type signal peptide-containing protein [Oscillospiraceae bacterium]
MKKLLVLLWMLVIPISYMIGSSYAWFNDSVTSTAVISSGDIDIEQSEVFNQNQVIAPVIPNEGYDVSTWENYVQ